MKIKDIDALVKDFEVKDKSMVFSVFSGHYETTYYSTNKTPGRWMEENIKFLNTNQELEVNSLMPKFDYKISTAIVHLMAYAKKYKKPEVFDFFKEHKLESLILSAIDKAMRYMMTHELRSQYYLSLRQCLDNHCFDLQNPVIQEQIKQTFKKATIENNRKHYSHALFKVAEYFYDNRDTLDKAFALEMIEYYLVTGKYIKGDLVKIVTMSNWREQELAIRTDTIECSCIIKRINPIKVSMDIKEDKAKVETMITSMHVFLQRKLYTQDQHVSIDITDKAADKLFIISFEKINEKIQTASQFITYFTNQHLTVDMYEEIWDKIAFKNKLTEKLPQKSSPNIKNKI